LKWLEPNQGVLTRAEVVNPVISTPKKRVTPRNQRQSAGYFGPPAQTSLSSQKAANTPLLRKGMTPHIAKRKHSSNFSGENDQSFKLPQISSQSNFDRKICDLQHKQVK